MAVNIYDVAKLSGVSIATVSRVVNGSKKVSEKTRQKVLKVMEEYGYTPNVFARGLGLDSMKTIGILCPDISDVYNAEAIAYLAKLLYQYEYDFILGCSGYSQEAKEAHTKLLLSKRIDALILVSSTYVGRADHKEDVEYIHEAAKQTPVFIINGYVDGENIYCSYCDDFHATYDVTKEYIEKGKKRILFLSDSYSYSALRKLAGYEAALADAGRPILPELEFYTKSRIHPVRDDLLAQKGLEFDSVVATTDVLAIGALKYAKARGLDVPGDVSITGYNNSQLSVSCEPELTSVNNHLEEICGNTVDFMFRVLQGEKDVPARNKVAYSIKRRCTT